MSAPDTKLTAQTNPELVSTDSSMTFHTANREVLRITNEARLVIGEGLSKDETTQEVAKLLIAAFEEQIQEMVDARVAADTARLNWLEAHALPQHSPNISIFDLGRHFNGFPGSFRAAIDAAMKEASK
jgi:NAD(P)H-hydrate repair Nnr-like enzyme with NAD(P)H-hydrate dehydratase domain